MLKLRFIINYVIITEISIINIIKALFVKY